MKKLFIFIYILLVIIILFFILEFVVNKMNFRSNLMLIDLSNKNTAYKISENTILGWELKSNYINDNPDNHNTFLYVNNLGQRDVNRKQKGNKKRISIVGDSVVVGHGISDLNKTISRQLDIMIEPEVLNFGVGGYAFSTEVEYINYTVVKYNPQVIVIVFVENDDVPTANMNLSRKLNPIVRALFTRSKLFMYLVERINLFNLRVDLSLYTNLKRQEYLLTHNDSIENNFIKLNTLSKNYNFTTIIIFWPSFPIDEQNNTWLNEDMYENIKYLSEKHNVIFYSLAENFQEDYLNTETNENPALIYTIGDGMHSNEYGAYIAAKALKKILIKEGLI